MSEAARSELRPQVGGDPFPRVAGCEPLPEEPHWNREIDHEPEASTAKVGKLAHHLCVDGLRANQRGFLLIGMDRRTLGVRQVEQKRRGRLPAQSVLVERDCTRGVSKSESHVRGIVLNDRVRRALREESGVALVGFYEVAGAPGAHGESALGNGIVVCNTLEARELADGRCLGFDCPGCSHHRVCAEPCHRRAGLPQDRLKREPKHRGGAEMNELCAPPATRERDAKEPEPDSR